MPTIATKIIGSNNYFSLISLNIKRLNSPITRHRLTDWMHKENLAFSCIQETHFNNKDSHYLRVKGWKTIFQANSLKKQAGVVILISNKIDVQQKLSKKARRDTSYSSKENPPRGTLNPEYLYSKCKGSHIH